MKTCFLQGVALLLLAVSPADRARANPSTKDPEAVLQIRPGEHPPGDYIKPDYDAINARYRKAKTESDEMWQRFEAKKLTLADAKKVSPLALVQARLRRDASFLKLRGEAAGWDLAVRNAELDQRLASMIRELLKLPNIPLAALSQQIEKDYAAGVKRLPQIEALIKRGQVCQAEGEFYEILDSIHKNAVWFPTGDFTEKIRPFPVPIEAAVSLRRDQAAKELRLVAKQFPDFARLQQELIVAASSIATTGKVPAEGQMVAGPEFLKAWHDRWPLLQAAGQRGVLAQRALEQMGIGEPVLAERWQRGRQDFAGALPKLLAAVIQSDANRSSAVEAAALYPEYLAACAAICSQGPRADLQAALDPALWAFAVKAGLEKEVTAYRNATEPVLGWKRLFARAQAKALSAGEEPVQAWASKVFTTPFQPHTILPQTAPTIQQALVISSANQVLPPVIPAENAPKITLADLVPANASRQRWVARYQGRVFGLTGPPSADGWKREVDQLRQLLLLNDAAQPLTLSAAASLTSARAGVFEAAGGPLSQATLDGLLSRFIALPDEAASLLPLGPLGDERVQDQDPTQALRLRCDIVTPRWYQHECFVLVQ